MALGRDPAEVAFIEHVFEVKVECCKEERARIRHSLEAELTVLGLSDYLRARILLCVEEG